MEWWNNGLVNGQSKHNIFRLCGRGVSALCHKIPLLHHSITPLLHHSSSPLGFCCPLSARERRYYDRKRQQMNDWELLQNYARRGSDGAFRTLVERYLNLVHSVAMRQVQA